MCVTKGYGETKSEALTGKVSDGVPAPKAIATKGYERPCQGNCRNRTQLPQRYNMCSMHQAFDRHVLCMPHVRMTQQPSIYTVDPKSLENMMLSGLHNAALR